MGTKGAHPTGLNEIAYAREKGFYSEYKILRSSSFELQGKFVKKVDIYLVKNNIESYSQLYLTECNSTLVKIRMTMPDNETNRNTDRWQKFVVKAFSTIIENIDKV